MTNYKYSPEIEKIFLEPGVLEDEEDAVSVRSKVSSNMLSPHPYIEITPIAAQNLSRISTQTSLTNLNISRIDNAKTER